MCFNVLVKLTTSWECLFTALIHVAQLLKLLTVHLTFVIFQVERISVGLPTLVANQLRLGLVRQFVLIQSSSRIANLSALVARAVDLLTCYALVDVGLQFFKTTEFPFTRHADVVARIRQIDDDTFRTRKTFRLGLHRRSFTLSSDLKVVFNLVGIIIDMFY